MNSFVRFLLFIILITSFSEVFAQPEHGDPPSVYVGFGRGSASPWGKPKLTAGVQYTFSKKDNKSTPIYFSIGANYTPLEFSSKKYTYTQISVPILVSYNFDNNKVGKGYRTLEVFTGLESSTFIKAQPIDASVKDATLQDALKIDSFNKNNLGAVLRAEYGGNRLRLGAKYMQVLGDANKDFRHAQFYLRIKLGKVKDQ